MTNLFKYTIVLITLLFSIVSCGNKYGNKYQQKITLEVSRRDLIVDKFEYEGEHYIMFKYKHYHGGGVTLDPDYLFVGDTINYKGDKYIKIK